MLDSKHAYSEFIGPGKPMGMYLLGLHTHGGNWVELCNYVQSIPAAKYCLLHEQLLKMAVIEKRDSTEDTYVGFEELSLISLLAQESTPIADYLVKKELSDTLSLTSLPMDEPIDTLFALPYPVINIKTEGDQGVTYDVLSRKTPLHDMVWMRNGNIMFILSPDTTLRDTTKNDTAGSVLVLQRMLGILTYITHGGDTVETRRDGGPRKGKKYRNRQQAETVVRGVVGGKFAVALRAWEQAQDTDKGGTHASPRPHLRAGHWHTYWTGVGRTRAIRKFLHPCLVNADGVAPGTEIHVNVRK